MARLFMRGGLVALVDDSDYERAKQIEWRVKRPYFYVYNTQKNCPDEWRYLHKFILRVEPGQIVDHANGNPLDNRRKNLRICTPAENSRNRFVNEHPTKSSKFKGVCRIDSNRWSAGIACDGQYYHLGIFGDEVMAAKAYDVAAKEKFKEFAKTNEMMGLFAGKTIAERRRRFRRAARATTSEHLEANTFQLWTRVPEKDRRNIAGGICGMAYKTKGGMIFHFPPGVEPKQEEVVCKSSHKARQFIGSPRKRMGEYMINRAPYFDAKK